MSKGEKKLMFESRLYGSRRRNEIKLLSAKRFNCNLTNTDFDLYRKKRIRGGGEIGLKVRFLAEPVRRVYGVGNLRFNRDEKKSCLDKFIFKSAYFNRVSRVPKPSSDPKVLI